MMDPARHLGGRQHAEELDAGHGDPLVILGGGSEQSLLVSRRGRVLARPPRGHGPVRQAPRCMTTSRHGRRRRGKQRGRRVAIPSGARLPDGGAGRGPGDPLVILGGGSEQSLLV